MVIRIRQHKVQNIGSSIGKLKNIIEAFPSEANYVLFRVENAGEVWRGLLACGVFVRDFSRAPYLAGCLRVSVGTPEENERFLAALGELTA